MTLQKQLKKEIFVNLGHIFTIAFLSLSLFFGCAKNTDTTEPSPAAPPASKPLPTGCSDEVGFITSWQEDADSISYEFAIGIEPGVYYETYTTSKPVIEFSRSLFRGVTFYVHLVKKIAPVGESQTKDFSFFVPTCDQRAEWKAQHPEYEEPLNFPINWGK